MSREQDMSAALSQPLVRIQAVAAPVLDTTSLNNILKSFLARLDQQDQVIRTQQENIDQLQREVASLRSQQDDVQSVKRDLKRATSDMDNVKAKQRLQTQRIDQLDKRWKN